MCTEQHGAHQKVLKIILRLHHSCPSAKVWQYSRKGTLHCLGPRTRKGAELQLAPSGLGTQMWKKSLWCVAKIWWWFIIARYIITYVDFYPKDLNSSVSKKIYRNVYQIIFMFILLLFKISSVENYKIFPTLLGGVERYQKNTHHNPKAF